MLSAISIVESEAGQKIRLSFRANKNQADFCLIVKASRARGRENAAEWLTLETQQNASGCHQQYSCAFLSYVSRGKFIVFEMLCSRFVEIKLLHHF